MDEFREFSTACRFCLCEDHEKLLTVSEILSCSLTIDLIELFTGVVLSSSDPTSLAVCGHCRDILYQTAQFRNTCLNNDILFRESFKQCPTPSGISDNENEARSKRDDTSSLVIASIDQKEEILKHSNCNQEPPQLSFIYTELWEEQLDEAEIINEQEQETLPKTQRDMQLESLNVCTKISSSELIVPGQIDGDGNSLKGVPTKTDKLASKCKRQLCVTCGKLVSNLHYHSCTHKNDPTLYACPHCPRKMKNQSNLARHIGAVHLKKIVKSCDPCGRGFGHINSYNAHMRSRHGMGEPYKCEICLKTFKQPSGYKKHISLTHSKERNFPCGICGKPFKDKQALKLHKNVHSNDRPYKCGMCPKQFKGASAKRTHELTHVGVVFQCTFCDKSYHEIDVIPASDMDSSLTSELIEQFTGIQIDYSGKLSYSICLCCKDKLLRSVEYRKTCLNNDILFKQLFFIKTDFKDDHTEESKRCTETIEWDSAQIEFILPTSETIRQAIENDDESCVQSCSEIEPEPEESSSPLTVKVNELELPCKPANALLKPDRKQAKKKQLCVLCGKTVNYLARHLNSHNKNSTYSCPHCFQQHNDQSNLMRHIRAVHQKKEIMVCKPCDRGFTSKNSYDAHMRAQHGVGELFKCNICSKTFKHPSGYKKHVSQSHTDERKYGCTVCGKLFKDRQVLQQHGKVHSTSRPYECRMCSKQFKSQFARVTHELTHSGTVFPCSACDKSYRYKSLLSQHVKKVHPEEC
uniref:Protein krueppel n=1 Tax=Anopheles christyi TaxID=43041 RepID=A0A182K5P5_9DIPT